MVGGVGKGPATVVLCVVVCCCLADIVVFVVANSDLI